MQLISSPISNRGNHRSRSICTFYFPDFHLTLRFLLLKYRVFSRIALIPFKEVDKEQNLETHLLFDEKRTDATTNLAKNIGVFRELAAEFEDMIRDSMFKTIATQMMGSGLDVHAQFNYVLLLFSTGVVSWSDKLNTHL